MANHLENDRPASYNGVRYIPRDGEHWYAVDDVRNILGAWSFDEREIDRFHDVTFGDVGDVRFMSSAGLATVVDAVVGTDYYSPRNMWIQGWYEDLEHYVETGEELEDFGQGTGDSIMSMIDGTCAMRAKGLRESAREAADELREADSALETARTFLDGFSSALSVAGMDRGTCLYTLGDSLACAASGVAGALVTVDGIAGGDGDDE